MGWKVRHLHSQNRGLLGKVGMKTRMKRFLNKMEVDRAVFFGVLTRIWSIVAGSITALLIAIKFSPVLQGYYYVFWSIFAFQTFAELGLSSVVVQFASHEWSKLYLDKEGNIKGDEKAISRLISLATKASTWYSVGAFIVIFGLGAGGYLFFYYSQNFRIGWELPWLTLCFLSGINFFLVLIWSLLEGCNQVSNVYAYRFFQGLATNLSIWLAIASGAKLWAAPISIAVILMASATFLKRKYFNFLKTLFFSRPTTFFIEWRKEVVPLQWRMALIWISNYFVFWFMTPVIFHYHGAVMAGQFGMTWSVVSAIGMIASSWIFPKAPQFGILISRKKYNELDRLFLRITRMMVIVMLTLASAILLGVVMLNFFKHPFAKRILPILPTALFLAAQIIMTLTLPVSTYLRAHKKEPTLVILVTSGILTGLLIFVLGKYSSVTGVAIGYLSVNVLSAPLLVLIWNRCRRAWHTDGIA